MKELESKTFFVSKEKDFGSYSGFLDLYLSIDGVLGFCKQFPPALT